MVKNITSSKEKETKIQLGEERYNTATFKSKNAETRLLQEIKVKCINLVCSVIHVTN